MTPAQAAATWLRIPRERDAYLAYLDTLGPGVRAGVIAAMKGHPPATMPKQEADYFAQIGKELGATLNTLE